MKRFFVLLLLFTISACRNEVEEVKNPLTGKLLKRFEYRLDDAGQKVLDGEYREWDSSEKLIKDYRYIDGKLDGRCVTIAKDGTVFENQFRKGKMHGRQLKRSKDRVLLSRTNFSYDKLEGKQMFYDAELHQTLTAHYRNGIAAGKWTFNQQGKSFSIHFSRGICQELLGIWKAIHDDRSKLIFRNDGTYEFWFPYFKHYGEPVLQRHGAFKLDGNQLILTDEHRQEVYRILDLNSRQLIFESASTQFSKSIVWEYTLIEKHY